MNAYQKEMAIALASAFQNHLDKVGCVSNRLSDQHIASFLANKLPENISLIVEAHDDIHLCKFSFDQGQSHAIFAVGYLYADAYTLFPNHTETLITNKLAYWEPVPELNPVLNYHHMINGYPTVELTKLAEVYEQGTFTVTETRSTDEETTYMVSGTDNTISKGICIEVNVEIHEETGDPRYHGYSTSINGISWDAYQTLCNGEILVDELEALINTFDVTEQLLNRLEILERFNAAA